MNIEALTLIVLVLVVVCVALATRGEHSAPRQTGARITQASPASTAPWQGYGPGETWTEQDQADLLASLKIANEPQLVERFAPIVDTRPAIYGRGNSRNDGPDGAHYYGDLPGQRPTNPPPADPPDCRPGYRGPVKPLPDNGAGDNIADEFERVYVRVRRDNE